ncbi:MAG: sodium:proton antiporter, partial [Pseudomonadota bacterium]
MISSPVAVFAIIGALGVGSQWLAWRLQLPAIVLMLAAGLAAGPFTGLIDPQAQLGDLFRPVIAVAVAVILFEGGITLNFRELGTTRPVVRRLVWVGAPLGWLFSTLACRYVAGLDWASSVVFGGILVITGPTVVIPLLRQARLAQRPAAALRWEAIVNDPVGALFAVFAFEVAIALSGAVTLGQALGHLALGVVVATVVGFAAGRATVVAFQRGWAPEYMKAPILLASVLAVYASTDAVLHESGLLAVTVMGVVIGNARLPSLTELIRFKEHMTILLVSGVFILLAASLDLALIAGLDWRAALFVVVVIVVARPLAIGLALLGTDLPKRERAMVAWVAPRGVVAVAVAGFFGGELAALGYPGGAELAALAFVLVTATVVLHGFTISPVARALGLTSTEPPGVLIIGGSPFAAKFAEAVRDAGAPALIADDDWWALRSARAAGQPSWKGEILSEAFEHHIDVNRYGHIVAATPNDAYNALVCTDFGPEFGRDNVRQIARHEGRDDDGDLPATLGGRGFAGGEDYETLNRRIADGWRIARTKLTDEYGFEAYREARPGAVVLGALRAGGRLVFFAPEDEIAGKAGDEMIALSPPNGDANGNRR